MPRRNAAQEQHQESRRTLRRSSRLKEDQTEDSIARTQDTLTASSFGNSDTAIAPFANNEGRASLPQGPPKDNASLTVRARGRKRDYSTESNEFMASRKKAATTRLSLEPSQNKAFAAKQLADASPNVHVKYASTITPINSLQGRARTDEEEDVSVGKTKANLLNSNNDLESRSSATTSTVREQRETLPEGVVDLYPSKLDATKVGTCKQGYSVAKSLTESFLSSYGYEYYQALKDHERADDDAASCASSNHTFSTADSNVSAITETPRSSTSRRAPLPSIPYRPVLGSAPLVGELEVLPRQRHLTPKMRGLLVDWLIELAEEYRFNPLTLQFAVALVDKSLACGAPTVNVDTDGFFTVQREMLQCVGCACMWIASKYEEVEPPCAVDFVYISDNSYTKDQIADMELTVCTALEFRLFQVTPVHFIPEFLRASCACGDPNCSAPENPLLKNMVLYLLELSLLPHELAYVNASLKAAAVVYLARVTLGIRSSAAVGSNGGYWTKTLEHYTGYDLADLEETVRTIHRYHFAAEESQFKSVYVKFGSEKYNSVSLKTVALESELGFSNE